MARSGLGEMERTRSRFLPSRRERVRHYRAPAASALSDAERRSITIVFGGLNWRHDYLAQAVFEGAGYRCEILPPPDEEAYELGYRYCSPGQCNPLYFTAGSLLKFLRELERRGLSRSEIAHRYVFFFARSCGPCRFGMYEADYRAALRLAGFPDFRVVPFQLHGGIHQSEREGLAYGIDLGLGIYKALLLADLLRDMALQIRPYELRPGDTDRAFAWCLEKVADHLRETVAEGRQKEAVGSTGAGRFTKTSRWIRKIREQLQGEAFHRVLDDCRRRIAAVEVDRLQVKPIVKLTGELFAHLTEGPGNYDMFSLLEEEGAEVFPDPLGAMLTHLLYQRRRRLWHQVVVEGRRRGGRSRGARAPLRLATAGLPLWFAETIYRHHYAAWGRALGGLARPLSPQVELARLAAPFYHPLLRGGEAHLEVGKGLYYTLHRYCHAVLSLKPFGCMPSAQSDGAQAAVQGRYPELLFLSLETGHDGAVLARSRVQMLLSEARRKAREEFEQTLKETNWDLGALRRWVDHEPRFRSALFPAPRDGKAAATAARFVRRVAAEIRDEKRRGDDAS